MLNIVVCIKQVIDPEAPSSTFKLDVEAKRAIPAEGIPPVLNPFDENALEAALRIKDKQPARITVISIGRQLAQRVLRRCLAVGADDLVILEDDDLDSFDSYFTAYILANVIQRKIGQYDIILCGREASDSDAGQVGSGIAEILGIPSITIARKVLVNNGSLTVERLVSYGYEVIEVSMPALVTASNEVGELRMATVQDIIGAQKKPITVYSKNDLEIDAFPKEKIDLLKLYIPIHKVNTEIITGDTVEEAACNLASRLHDAKII